MQPDGERNLFDDWGDLTRASGVVWRYPFQILFGTALITAVVFLNTQSRAPEFRGSATLLLEDAGVRTPMRKELGIPTGTTEADAAATALTSSALVREVVSTPPSGFADPAARPLDHRLGLTTLVEDESRGTVRGLLARWTGRRSADFQLRACLDALDTDAPLAIRVQFLAADRIALEIPGDEDLRAQADYRPGAAIEFAGLRLRLRTVGRIDDRPFLVWRLSEDEAVTWVQDRLSIKVDEERAGVVNLGFVDTDPHRATRVVNAIVESFLATDEEALRYRAEDMVRHLETELASRLASLGELNDGIASIMADHPDAIELESAARRLSEHLTAAQMQLLAAASRRASLERVHWYLAEGNRTMVSRVGQELDDPLTRKYLDHIATLEQQALGVNREDAGEFQRRMLLKIVDAEEMLRVVEGRAAFLDTVLADLDAGAPEALARLGDEGTETGILAVDAVTQQYLAEYATSSRRLTQLEAEFFPEYFAVVLERRRREGLCDAIRDRLRARRGAVAMEVEHTRGLVKHWAQLTEDRPHQERERIEEVADVLWEKVQATIAARILGLVQEERDLADRVAVLEARIADLPHVRALLSTATTRKGALEGVVADLIEKKERAEVAQAGTVAAAQLVQRSIVAHVLRPPSVLLGLVLGVLLGGILSVAVCLVHDRYRGRLCRNEDYDGFEGLDLLGTVPTSKELSWQAFQSSDSPAADAFRALRARLRGWERRRTTHPALGVTSCWPGEGKTTATAGLAIAFALEGRRVLVADGNLRSPALHRCFGGEEEPGLVDVLRGRRAWGEVVRPSGIEHLDLLVAGVADCAPADCVSGSAMEEWLDDVRRAYDVVLIDLPSVASGPEVEGLGDLLDGMVLLCGEERGATRREVREVVRILRATGTNLLGFVRMPRAGTLRVANGPVRRRAAA